MRTQTADFIDLFLSLNWQLQLQLLMGNACQSLEQDDDESDELVSEEYELELELEFVSLLPQLLDALSLREGLEYEDSYRSGVGAGAS